MVFSDNPQSVVNGWYSASRNVFLTVSVAVAMYGFSDSFKIKYSTHIVKDISLLIFIFSFMLGLNNIIFFNNYIKKMEKQDNLPLYVDISSWKRHLYIKIYFMILLTIIILAIFIRFINRKMS
tara:strand:+ start:40 stop:408 length:369 start_codon:yes stop_codon:yes gene_type:complete